MMMVIFRRDGWNRKDNMKKVAHTEYKLHCEFCDLEMEDYEERYMKAHEDAHRQTAALRVGQRLKFRKTTHGTEWGRPTDWTETKSGVVVRINQRESSVMIEDERGERYWISISQIFK